MPNQIMPAVEHVVVVMLENRSLDNVLGYCYGNGELPLHVYPPGSDPKFDGLADKSLSLPALDSSGNLKSYPIQPIAQDQMYAVPGNDPYEKLKESAPSDPSWKGVMNQMFGNQDCITQLPVSPTPKPQMQGFLQDYYSPSQVIWQGLDITWMLTPYKLPNINALARGFAVSDRWFCSVPSQTNPNRAFAMCGNSLGRESNQNLNAVEQFQLMTIFNKLDQAGKTCGLYTTDTWENGLSYTEYTFPWISQLPSLARGSIRDFTVAAGLGRLPAFSYIEPQWGYGAGGWYVQGTDMHPPTHAEDGDTFLQTIASSLMLNPSAWAKTLLVITFDEHGGTYDHVPPPWGAVPSPEGATGASGFKFDLYGPRVPMILVSPLVQQGTVFRSNTAQPFDHTSLIKTLFLWAGVDLSTAGMGPRMPLAPTFEGVIADHVVNTTRPAFVTHAPHVGPLDEVLKGVPAAEVRRILNREKTIEGITAAAAAFKHSAKKR